MCIHFKIQNFAMHVLKNFDCENDDDDDETNGDDLLTDGSRRGTNGPGWLVAWWWQSSEEEAKELEGTQDWCGGGNVCMWPVC